MKEAKMAKRKCRRACCSIGDYYYERGLTLSISAFMDDIRLAKTPIKL
jgi:hypothetical protein